MDEIKYKADILIKIPENEKPENTIIEISGNPNSVMSALIAIYIDIAIENKITLKDLTDLTMKNLNSCYHNDNIN